MIQVVRLGPADLEEMEEANRLFLEVFAEEAYLGRPAGRDHLLRVLEDTKFVALVARVDGVMVGALAGYELVKFEAERSDSTFTTSRWSKCTGGAALRPR